jgi:hypothetical protein
LESYFSNALFSLMLMSGHLGMDEFIVFFWWQMIWNHYWKFSWMFIYILCPMLATFLGSRGAYVQCKHVHHVLQRIMLCGFTKEFIHHYHGVGMKFNICWVF